MTQETRLISVLAVLGICTVLPGVGRTGELYAQDPGAEALMEEAGSRYQALQGFCATFRQTLAVPLLDQVTDSQGRLCQEKPNLFAMRFTQPEGDAIVADGEWFWVYYPSSDARQVLQFAMNDHPGGMDFHREFLEAPGEKYRMTYLGEEVLDGSSTAHVISLVPLDPAGFDDARIWLDRESSLILQARIEMENGSVRTVRLSDIELNPTPDPDRYRFTPPPGAQVIRR